MIATVAVASEQGQYAVAQPAPQSAADAKLEAAKLAQLARFLASLAPAERDGPIDVAERLSRPASDLLLFKAMEAVPDDRSGMIRFVGI